MLKTSQIAPDFTLPLLGGSESNYYRDAEGRTSVLIFYKFSCGTSQLALPYLQKIYDAYGDVFFFVGIQQDEPDKSAEFREQFGITMPILMDREPYSTGASYGIATVPSIFLVDPDHAIRHSGEGFAKKEILDLANVLAEKAGRPQIDVFGSAEVPDFKPG